MVGKKTLNNDKYFPRNCQPNKMALTICNLISQNVQFSDDELFRVMDYSHVHLIEVSLRELCSLCGYHEMNSTHILESHRVC